MKNIGNALLFITLLVAPYFCFYGLWIVIDYTVDLFFN